METVDVVLVTLLTVVQIISFGSFSKRMVEMKDELWIEVLIFAFCGLFEYLILR